MEIEQALDEMLVDEGLFGTTSAANRVKFYQFRMSVSSLDAAKVAAEVRKEMSNPFVLSRTEDGLSISFGSALDRDTAARSLMQADYKVKYPSALKTGVMKWFKRSVASV